MNKKLIYRISSLLIMTLIFSISIPVVSAADIELINTDYTLIESKSDETNQYYNIFVTIQNTQTTPFENLSVEIIDEWEIPTSQTYTFQPQETKTFTFEDVPFSGGINHQITIKYQPANTSRLTSLNSGSTIINMTYNPAIENESPFIHSLGLILLVSFIGLLMKKKKRI